MENRGHKLMTRFYFFFEPFKLFVKAFLQYTTIRSFDSDSTLYTWYTSYQERLHCVKRNLKVSLILCAFYSNGLSLTEFNTISRIWEQDNSPPDNCPPQMFFSFIFSFWLPLSDYEFHCTTILSLHNTLLLKPVLSLYLACNHFFSKFFLIINLCT